MHTIFHVISWGGGAAKMVNLALILLNYFQPYNMEKLHYVSLSYNNISAGEEDIEKTWMKVQRVIN